MTFCLHTLCDAHDSACGGVGVFLSRCVVSSGLIKQKVYCLARMFWYAADIIPIWSWLLLAPRKPLLQKSRHLGLSHLASLYDIRHWSRISSLSSSAIIELKAKSKWNRYIEVRISGNDISNCFAGEQHLIEHIVGRISRRSYGSQARENSVIETEVWHINCVVCGYAQQFHLLWLSSGLIPSWMEWAFQYKE